MSNEITKINDEMFMRVAIDQAKIAASIDEVPIGAVIVRNGEIIAKSYNTRESDKNPTAHAEMKAIETAASYLGGWRLLECTLYVTVEPCVMCAGAVINARIPRVVYGASDFRFGGMGSLYSIHEGKLNHTPEVVKGILERECAELMSDYFRKKRGK